VVDNGLAMYGTPSSMFVIATAAQLACHMVLFGIMPNVEQANYSHLTLKLTYG
jgi:hypothetical protein